ncbi:S66 peptidase family protein [Caldalkalibacillus salinus]|uniref:S66 peptidase family protein n=1 Tax=Caldalkalibacillus salinus TaxID=2803787 RepID=UPI001922FCBA|nr:LD-carboxypeptidase [Caldalkalibacillus salinus]
MSVIKPQSLRPGDTIGIVAPASPPDLKRLYIGCQFYESLGLKVRFGRYIEQTYGYLAGSDKERLQDLHDMFKDDDIRGIFCACGGYGTARIAEHIDYDLIQRHPKVFLGYSDITFLHVAIFQRTGLVTFHGPMPSSDLGYTMLEGHPVVHPMTEKYLKQIMAPRQMKHAYSDALDGPIETSIEVLVEAEDIVQGTIMGGNLSLLVSTLGTPFEVDTKGKILFIEEVDEEPYRVDRMLNQLRLAGKFTDAEGIIIADFAHCGPQKRKPSLSLEEVLSDHLQSVRKPLVRGFQVGHCEPHMTIPIGVQARVDTTNATLTIEPGLIK